MMSASSGLLKTQVLWLQIPVIPVISLKVCFFSVFSPLFELFEPNCIKKGERVYPVLKEKSLCVCVCFLSQKHACKWFSKLPPGGS